MGRTTRARRIVPGRSLSSGEPLAASGRPWTLWAWAGVIAAAGALAYSNSFSGEFIFDDRTAIVTNPDLRSLWPPWRPLWAPQDTTVAGRPIVSLSLAVNYALGGLNVQGYHAFNLTVHIFSGLVLFGIVRRTLCSRRLKERFGSASTVLAAVVAGVWVVHPLHTGSVTYVVQRAESLMGLFYLLTLLCAIRGFGTTARRRWCVLAIVCCGLGMGSKEVMVTAPLMVLLYDRVFVSGSFREALGRSRALYAGLALTWMILAALAAASPRALSAGFGLSGMTPVDYAKNQCVAIVQYLRLSFWPHPLVLDYGAAEIRTAGEVAPRAAPVLALLAGTAVALRHWPPVGFLGLWFFLILGPTSSFFPIVTEAAAEHRMYLSLAAVIALAVLGGGACLGGILGRLGASGRTRRLTGLAAAALIAAVLGWLTFQRNRDYRDELTIWADAAAKRPGNARALNNLGCALEERGQRDQAIDRYREAIRIRPEYAAAHDSLAHALVAKGDLDGAIRHFELTVRLVPKSAAAHFNLAKARLLQGSLEEALRHLREAVRIDPGYAKAHTELAGILADRGDLDEAVEQYRIVVQQDPKSAQAHYGLGLALMKKGDLDGAAKHLSVAVGLRPGFAEARRALVRCSSSRPGAP